MSFSTKDDRTQEITCPHCQKSFTLSEVGDKPPMDRSVAEALRALQQVLYSFGVDARVSGYTIGPRVIRFEVAPAPGVDIGKIVRLEQNIKMSMRVHNIRIQAPIPGKEVVGVEIPHLSPQTVLTRDIMESAAWRDSKADIPIVIGKDIAGEPVVIDLSRAPHLLIGGIAGSGKSALVNSLIISLLAHFSADELQLIMFDPKVVELECYQNLPQLITPVINDSEKLPSALHWAVTEMEKRYRFLARAQVKKIKQYNARMSRLDAPFADEYGALIPKKLPYIVIIIDDLADAMMLETRDEVETCINRIAAKGRAVGVHMVIATQSPRKDVVTGLIKANLPTRIAFMVSGQMDSRVLLDRNGAELLLGKGDMLLMSTGGILERVQGAMVKDEDIEQVVRTLAEQHGQLFIDGVVSDEPKGESTGGAVDSRVAESVQRYLQPGDDELVARALEAIIVERKASSSMIQRRLRIGYNRAAALLELFEERGLISPVEEDERQWDVLIWDELEVE